MYNAINKFIIAFRSLLFCLKYLPIKQAIYIPICIGHNVKIVTLKKGQIKIKKNQRYHIKIGLGGSPGLQNFNTCIMLSKESCLEFKGSAIISEGTSIRLDKEAKIVFGNEFYCNKNNYFRSTNLISFGNRCLLGWNNTFNTTDGHYITNKDGVHIKKEAPIIVGEHVWITTNCSILNGVKIADNTIVAQHSVITKAILENNTLVGGLPAKILKRDVNWSI